MQYKTGLTAIFNCSLERAFKTPMLCDVTKVHTGYGPMTRCVSVSQDKTWGQIGGSRRVLMEPNFFFKEGQEALDVVLERVENKYWKIEIRDFKYASLGFEKFQGEWYTKENKNGSVEVIYVYTLFSNKILAYPFHWLFTKLFWRNYMKHAMHQIQELAYNNEPYVQR